MARVQLKVQRYNMLNVQKERLNRGEGVGVNLVFPSL